MPISDAFWQTIQNARPGPGPLDPSADPAVLAQILEARSSNEVNAFGREFYQALIDLNQWSIWGAGHTMTLCMSGDSFHYFRSWLIGKGKEAYETAVSSPDDLGRFADPGETFFENELLEYVAGYVLKPRGLPDPRRGFAVSADAEPVGQGWTEDELDELFPKLTSQFEDTDDE